MPDQPASKLPGWLLPAVGIGAVALLVLRGSGSSTAAAEDPLMQQAKQIQLKQAADLANYQQGLRSLSFEQQKLQLSLQQGAVSQYLAAPFKCPKGNFAKDAQGNLYCRTSAGGTGLGGFLNQLQGIANGILGLEKTGTQIAAPWTAEVPSRPTRYTPGTI